MQPTYGINRLRRAFTLVEILVVIAMIAILASMLLRVVSKTRGQAQQAQCMNNQRQLAMAWGLYTLDNDSAIVANGIPRDDASLKLWVQGYFANTADNTRPELVLDPKYALFANYIRSPSAYLCAADKDPLRVNGTNCPRIRSYSMNVYVGWVRPTVGDWDTRLSASYRIFRKTSDINMPANQLFLFQDVNSNSICWPYFGVYMNKDSFFNFPSSVHSKGGLLSFSDAHVERHAWQDKRTIEAQSSHYHDHDEPSPNNPDVRWLQQRTTTPN